jgi:type II secretory pathway pseudopilin PulG
VELLVVIAIVAILIGLLLPAVQKVRESAAKGQCLNNSKQMLLACHIYQGAYNRLPPGADNADSFPQGKTYGTIFFHILPFIEQDALYNTTVDSALIPGANICLLPFDPSIIPGYPGPPGPYGDPLPSTGQTPAYQKGVKTFLCPADFTANDMAPGVISPIINGKNWGNWGAASYAFNALVFCNQGYYRPNPPNYGFTFTTGHQADGHASMQATVPDGLSNTIFIAEKLAQCTSNTLINPLTGEPPMMGGTIWAYANQDTGDAASVAWFGAWHPGIDLAFWFRLPGYTPIGPASVPQIQPVPPTGPQANCDPTRASTMHTAACIVGMGDGSARYVSSGVSGATWFAANTPAAQDILGSDW